MASLTAWWMDHGLMLVVALCALPLFVIFCWWQKAVLLFLYRLLLAVLLYTAIFFVIFGLVHFLQSTHAESATASSLETSTLVLSALPVLIGVILCLLVAVLIAIIVYLYAIHSDTTTAENQHNYTPKNRQPASVVPNTSMPTVAPSTSEANLALQQRTQFSGHQQRSIQSSSSVVTQ